MYYNLTSIHSVLRLAPFGSALTASFDTFVGADGASVDDERPLDRHGRLRQVAEVAAIARENGVAVSVARSAYSRFERTVDAFAERTAPDRLASDVSVDELRDALSGFMDIR